MVQLDGTRCALVTGASRGIGRTVALRLASEGYLVHAVARTVEHLESLRHEVEAAGGAIAPLVVDLAALPDFDEFVDSVCEDHDGPHVVVANAGINPILKVSVDVSVADFDEIFRLNVRSHFLLVTAAVRSMLAHGIRGSIVSIGSIGAHAPLPRTSVYAMSKAAVSQFSRVLAAEVAPHGIRVNTVEPGFIATDLTSGLRSSRRHREGLEAAIPMGRIGDPTSVAAAVSYLVSQEASYITGTELTVDGGFSLGRSWPPPR